MKRWLFAVLIVAMPTIGYSSTTLGDPDCGQWVKSPHPLDRVWLLGYLSGLNMAWNGNDKKPYDPLSKLSSRDQAYLWMDNYCKANPLKNVSTGAVNLTWWKRNSPNRHRLERRECVELF